MLKPKVYYKEECITADESKLLKLRKDDEGFYTRSNKIQEIVKNYLDLPGKAFDMFKYGKTRDKNVNKVRRNKMKQHGAKFNKDMGVWYAETRKIARGLIEAGYPVSNEPKNWGIRKIQDRNYIKDKNGDSSWETWAYNYLNNTWVFYKNENYTNTHC